MAKTKIVLLNCGSFNPITHMHLRMFELARDYLNKTGRFDVVSGIISPVHDKYGKKGLLPVNHRIDMIKLATSTSDWIKLDDWESKQDGWTRTRLVLDHAKEQIANGVAPYNLLHPNGSTVKVKLLCGADLLESFNKPNIWSKEDITAIVGQYGLCCITRNGYDGESVVSGTECIKQHEDSIDIIPEHITNEISATKIRESLQNGESVKYLIPDSVLEYIKNNKLYIKN
eukprot:gene5620-6311_t